MRAWVVDPPTLCFWKKYWVLNGKQILGILCRFSGGGGAENSLAPSPSYAIATLINLFVAVKIFSKAKNAPKIAFRINYF